MQEVERGRDRKGEQRVAAAAGTAAAVGRRGTVNSRREVTKRSERGRTGAAAAEEGRREMSVERRREFGEGRVMKKRLVDRR